VNAPERFLDEIEKRTDTATAARLSQQAGTRSVRFTSKATRPARPVSLRASWNPGTSGHGIRLAWVAVADGTTRRPTRPSAGSAALFEESCRIAAKPWFELALEVVRHFLSSSKMLGRGRVVAEGGHMHAKEILEHCLECDSAWSKGYTAGYRSVTRDAISAVPKRPTEPSGVTDRLRYFYDLGRGQGFADARGKSAKGLS
jgi:hypothetical protein